MIDKEIIDNLNNEDKLLLLRIEKWTWINSVDRCDWDWFYATLFWLN